MCLGSSDAGLDAILGAISGAGSGGGSGSGSGASPSLRISSRSFIWNILLLKPLRTFYLAGRINPTLFRKDFIHLCLHYLILTNLLCSLSASSYVNFLSYIS